MDLVQLGQALTTAIVAIFAAVKAVKAVIVFFKPVK